MTKRVVSLWLPTFATDWAKRTSTASNGAPSADHNILRWTHTPCATYASSAGGLRLVAVDHVAAEGGLAPGLTLSQARAMAPSLRAYPADPIGERRALVRLARWGVRYTPWTCPDETPADGLAGAGLWLDITGCGHLFGSEAALIDDLVQRLQRIGFRARAAIADTPGAAWAAARLAPGGQTIVLPEGKAAITAALAELPVTGLRLPAATLDGLDRLGLRQIGDLLSLPRGPLVSRLGPEVTLRLDQALGMRDEPISPLQPSPDFRVRQDFAEPIGRTDDIAEALRRLLTELCTQLGAGHLGARRLEYALFRIDGTIVAARVGTGRPERDPVHLFRLFAEKLERLDPGYGIETAILAAHACDRLAPRQDDFEINKECGVRKDTIESLRIRLLDRLSNRLGPEGVVRLASRAHHLPERAFEEIPITEDGERKDALEALAGEHRPHASRPIHLLATPEPVEAMAPVPDHPPVLFRWRGRPHRITRAVGPERIAPEWWRFDPVELASMPERTRDYYRVEDADGRRFWLFREGLYRPDRPPRWYLHGFFS